MRAPVSFLIAACLGVFAAAQTPALAAPDAVSAATVSTAATSVVDPAARASEDATTTVRNTKKSAAELGAAAHHYKPTDCNVPTPGKHIARCLSLVATTADQRLRVNADTPPATALTPNDIQSAYRLTPGGERQTVAIVDAYGYDAAEADLAHYRTQFGLPACTTDNGCFRKVDQRGGTNYPKEDAGWSLETALDVDAVSAACPSCHILLVQADTPSVEDLGAAVDKAVELGAKFVTNSYGLSDTAADGLSGADYDHPGVVVTVSTGDTGNEVQWPSSDPHVLAVGGTLLTRASDTARGWTEQAWSGGGSGCSTWQTRPDIQDSVGSDCARRATADISADADPSSGLAVYNSLQNGWSQVGGTSLSSPLVSAMYALAGAPEAGTYPNTYPYAHRADGLFDITTGTDGDCGTLLCEARTDWDGPTGLGSPNGVAALKPGTLATLSGHVTNKADGSPVAGATVSLVDEADQFTYHATTDSTGAYHAHVSASAYQVSASRFGYGAGTHDGVQVSAGHSASADFTLVKTPSHTVSGKVTDASGHGWPLYAKLTIDGYPDGPVYTNPKTGRYSVVLPGQADYTAHVTPVTPGYKPVYLDLPVANSDVQRDAAVTADMTQCAAPGYAYTAQASFEGWRYGAKFGWSVVNHNSSGGWLFGQPLGGTLLGKTDYAAVEPGLRGDSEEDTDLVSPVFSLVGEKTANLDFDAIFLLSNRAAFDVSVSTDGGTNWTPLYHRGSDDADVIHGDIPLTPAMGHSKVRVRFHFNGGPDSLLQLDNVSVGSCKTLGGGLIEGTVRDANTGHPVDGAAVTVRAGGAANMYGSAVSATTPDDASLADGFYWLYSPKAGPNTVTTSDPRYVTSTSVTSVSSKVTSHDTALRAGRLKVSGPVSLRTDLAGKATGHVTLTNTGGAPLKVTVAEQDADAAARAPEDDGAWQKLPDYPEPIRDNVVGVYRGKTYSVGGIDTPWGGTPTKHGYIYNAAAGSWTPIADMPEPRTGAAGAFLNGTLYVVGGAYVKSHGEAGTISASAFAYHPASDSWSKTADLPKALQGAAVAVLDGKLYVLGGTTPDGTQSAAAYRYDPARATWSPIANYPLPTASLGCGGMAGEVVCAGGVNDQGGHAIPQSTTYLYHPKSNKWTRAAEMPYSVFGASYSSANGELQVTAGFKADQLSWNENSGDTRNALQYDPVSDTWAALAQAPQAVSFSGSGTGCGITQIGGGDPQGLAGTVTAAARSGFGQCEGEDVNWLQENRTTISLAPGQSRQIEVTADAGVLAAPGSYAATLSMITDTPYVYRPVQVGLKATAPASWAEVSGTVKEAGGAPLAGATVTVSQHGKQFSVTTDSHGHYDVQRPSGASTLRATADGHRSGTREVVLKRGATTSADFSLAKS
ncbi:carboxypeptidase regulatory-like domain-containing protein [Streptomyces sp. NPDC087843]|uniref:carboxypeptidase regulatory-like domain-containing protein n=1 Tax=Streptomyces sp. NPDC087843 TaxID=3365804 RepID=UPI003823E587